MKHKLTFSIWSFIGFFNFDFKDTCQIPGYKSMVEMILNRSNRLSVLDLGYVLDVVIEMSSSQPA